jgi:hypothetical protein
MGGYTRAVSGQRLGKHVPAAADAHSQEEQCFPHGPCDVISEGQGVCEEKTWAREAEECSLLEAVARERMVKTHQAGKGLVDAVVVCELWRLDVAL